MNLSFNSLYAGYQNTPLLENINFTAESGKITALIGRNGAGKSTLIRCLMGQKKDYTGSVLLAGQDVRSLSGAALAEKVACLPQNLPRPHVKVRELVSFGRTPYTPMTGKRTPQDQEKISWAIRAVGLAKYQDAFVDALSGGERKKAFFAMTLAQDTPVIILDEPTAHLDMVSRFEFMELIETMCAQTGKTFLVVMHDLPEVLRCAHRIVTIHERTVTFDGTPEQCLASDVPQRCFSVQIHGNREEGFTVKPCLTEISEVR